MCGCIPSYLTTSLGRCFMSRFMICRSWSINVWINRIENGWRSYATPATLYLNLLVRHRTHADIPWRDL